MSADLTTREWIVQAMYLAASVLFILGLRSLTKPTQARLGMQQAAFGMLFAVIGETISERTLSKIRNLETGHAGAAAPRSGAVAQPEPQSPDAPGPRPALPRQIRREIAA